MFCVNASSEFSVNNCWGSGLRKGVNSFNFLGLCRIANRTSSCRITGAVIF